jgi:hypothetical protein
MSRPLKTSPKSTYFLPIFRQFRPKSRHLREKFAESPKSYPQLCPRDPQLYRPDSQLCRIYRFLCRICWIKNQPPRRPIERPFDYAPLTAYKSGHQFLIHGTDQIGSGWAGGNNVGVKASKSAMDS